MNQKNPNSTCIEGEIASYTSYGFDIASSRENETELFRIFLPEEVAEKYEGEMPLGRMVRVVGRLGNFEGHTCVFASSIEFGKAA